MLKINQVQTLFKQKLLAKFCNYCDLVLKKTLSNILIISSAVYYFVFCSLR